MLKIYRSNKNFPCGLSVAATPECFDKGISHPTSLTSPAVHLSAGLFFSGLQLEPTPIKKAAKITINKKVCVLLEPKAKRPKKCTLGATTAGEL
jgi:hypothetical protein